MKATHWNPGIFQYCDGKRNKIRWLKVHITISMVMPMWYEVLRWNTEETKGVEIPVS